MAAIVYGLVGMLGIGALNVLISLLNRKHDTFKVGFLIQLGNFLATLALFPILHRTIPATSVFFFLIIAGVTGALAFICINKAFKEGKASINSPIISTWGMITVILGFVILGESAYLAKLISMLVIVTGIFLSSLDIKSLLANKNLPLIPGVKWSLLAAVNLGISFFTITYFTSGDNWYSVNLFTRFWTITSYLVMAKATAQPVRSYFKVFPVLVLLAVFFDTSSMLTINLGYTTNEPGIVSLLASASPVSTLVLSYVVLKERITRQQLLGILVVISGIILLAAF